MARQYTRRPVLDRIREKIVETDGPLDSPCWVWTGSTANGYGNIRVREDDGYRTRRVHRVAYEEVVGPIPEGLDLDHLCRVRLCCNPEHLDPVDRSTNLLRGWDARGRMTDRECSVDGCTRNAFSRNLCGMHYQRRRNGVDMTAPAYRVPRRTWRNHAGRN